MKNKQKLLKVRRKVLSDGTHQKTSVGITAGGRICTTDQKTKKLNKKGDFAVSTTQVYRQPTEAALKNLSKEGIKVRVVNKGTAKKAATAKKSTSTKKKTTKPAAKKATTKKKSTPRKKR